MRSPVLLLPLLATVNAAWTPHHRSQPQSPTPVRRVSQTCVVSKSAGNGTDDSPNWFTAVQECNGGGVIVFQEGIDYNIFTPINATLSNVDVQIRGNLHLPQNITAIQAIVNKTSSGNQPWISLTGTNISLTGVQNVTTGWIYSYGEAWWDANVKNGTGLGGRPHLLRFNATDGYMADLKYKKPIAWVNALYGNDITVRNTFIDATTAPGGGFPFNTDGFDVTAKNVLIENSVILNGDDAITVENGAENVTVRNALIGGPGCHGTSVGSLGQDQTVFNRVKNILFTDITAVNCVYGARFKSWTGGQGLAQNITWQNFHVENVTFPIYVTQSYVKQLCSQGSAQTQNSGEGSNSTSTVAGRVNNASVVMEDFTYENWTGTINTYQRGDWSCVTNPCWYDVPGADGTQSIVIQCANSTSCSDYRLRNIEVVPQSSKPPSVLCTYLESTSNPELGFVCTNGTYVPTL